MAGSSSITYKYTKVNGQLNPMKIVEIALTADAADASFPVVTLPSDFGGELKDIGIVFDGTTPPNTLTYSLKDGYGLVLKGATGVTASSARNVLSSSVPTLGCSLTCTANATNSAKLKFILYVL